MRIALTLVNPRTVMVRGIAAGASPDQPEAALELACAAAQSELLSGKAPLEADGNARSESGKAGRQRAYSFVPGLCWRAGEAGSAAAVVAPTAIPPTAHPE